MNYNDAIAARALMYQHKREKLETMAYLTRVPCEDFAIVFSKWYQERVPLLRWDEAASACLARIQRTGKAPW